MTHCERCIHYDICRIDGDQMMIILKIIVIILFFALILGIVGGIIWLFISEDLQTKRYIKFLNTLNELEPHNGDKEQ